MKKRVKLFLRSVILRSTACGILFSLIFLGVSVIAEPKQQAVNILDYAGNVVNGDYTDAIRMAVAEARRIRADAIYFPPGRYVISDVINLNSTIPVGERVTIQQLNPDKDIFYADNAWNMAIKGFSFIGGRDQIAIGNKNTDQGFLIISECRFKDANGAAIRFIRNAPAETASTYCLVEKCHFSDCIQVLISVSDQTTFRDAWISTSGINMRNLAVIENYGILKCENILGVPRVSSTDQRWIDNYGSLICDYFRFGGEGAGFTPVVNYSKRVEQSFARYVVILNSYIAALGNNKRACAVYCEEIPNMIVISNCNLDGIPAVKVKETLDLKTYFAGVRDGMLRYSIDGNIGEFSGVFPEEMFIAATHRKINKFEYGDRQLSSEATQARLKKICNNAAVLPAQTEPCVMKYGLSKGTTGHQQVIDKNGYTDITPDSHVWRLDDNLDGVTEKCSDYLALTKINDDVAILNRIENGTSYPHFRIEHVKVDLNKTPFLTWRLKDNGVKGGHISVKVIDNATGEQVKLMENYSNSQFDYYAYDLRILFPKKTVVDIDIKFYLCKSREVKAYGKDMNINLAKGDWFLLDFIRLEEDGQVKTEQEKSSR